MDEIFDKLKVFARKHAKHLNVENEDKSLVKSVYDFTKSQEDVKKLEKDSALPELIVDGLDYEQVWQQIELQNAHCWDKLVWDVANCMSKKNILLFPVEIATKDAKKSEEILPSDDENSPSGEENSLSKKQDEDFEEIPEKKQQMKSKAKSKTSIVDDKFFKLQEMENFLLNEEKKDGKKVVVDSDDESIDLFEDVDNQASEEGGDNNMMYYDFFDGENQKDEYDSNLSEEDEIKHKPEKKKDRKVTFADRSSDDESDDSDDQPANKLQNNNDKKSDFELRQQRLKQQIQRLEEKTLKEAPWQLKGEVDATTRPQNSLLEEVVDFDLTSRPAPIITEQTTVSLEDIIKQRIKDKAWDDVVRKEKPVDDQLSFRKTEILDQSKSKLSLAQVYEAEYLKQKQTLSGDVEEEKEPESHTQVRDAMNKLFAKLDALCHYHYTPKAAQAEVKIVSNTPAISMEEVAPVATSDAALLAPEEVKKKRKGELMSKEERTQTDKNRERRKKKKLQKQKAKVTKVTEHRNTKKAVEASDKSLKTSKAFFQQLNEDATSLIKKNKRNVKNKGQ